MSSERRQAVLYILWEGASLIVPLLAFAIMLVIEGKRCYEAEKVGLARTCIIASSVLLGFAVCPFIAYNLGIRQGIEIPTIGVLAALPGAILIFPLVKILLWWSLRKKKRELEY